MAWKFYDATGSLLQGIADGSIASAKLAAESVDSDAYVDGSIDLAHMSANSVDSDQYVDASIDYAHIQDVAANSILVRDANSSGVLSAKALATTNILIGDGTGFTAASLSGQASMDNAGAVTIGTFNQTTTGSAATLTTARDIGGVSFNGSASIDLPGVNSAGNQNTSGTAAGLSATLVVGSGGTGITSLGSGVATFMGTPSSANLRSALTDETGTGGAVFATSPTLVTPALGTPASGNLTNCTGAGVGLGLVIALGG